MKPRYIALTPLYGELQWSDPPSDSLLSVQLSWVDFLKKAFHDQVVEVRQGFTALSICWKNPENQNIFRNSVNKISIPKLELSARIWELPVCYDASFGRDLGSLAITHRMTINELIELHSTVTYRLHFFGFLPGFMYLNGLPKQLHTPRKAIPDRSVEAGSVAIGGTQTGIYPIESPGGWHLIGKCPVSLFNPKHCPPVWAEPGDLIKFQPIDLGEMERLLHNPVFPKLQ
jgi:KipI family sensor histidine kinase inhibitor